MLEEIRSKPLNPVISKDCQFHYEYGIISWNKTIFREKISLINKISSIPGRENNFIPNKGTKNHKSVTNLLRALKPVTFKIKPKNKKDGSGFEFTTFDYISDDISKLNFIFDAIFLQQVFNVKKYFNHKIIKK